MSPSLAATQFTSDATGLQLIWRLLHLRWLPFGEETELRSVPGAEGEERGPRRKRRRARGFSWAARIAGRPLRPSSRDGGARPGEAEGSLSSGTFLAALATRSLRLPWREGSVPTGFGWTSRERSPSSGRSGARRRVTREVIGGAAQAHPLHAFWELAKGAPHALLRSCGLLHLLDAVALRAPRLASAPRPASLRLSGRGRRSRAPREDAR